MKNYHLKYASSVAVKVARANGTFPDKPEECSSCDRKKKVLAHHEDYAKPLDVIWLCGHCHQKRHHQLRVLGIAPMKHTPLLPFPEEFTVENLKEMLDRKRESGRYTVGAIRHLYKTMNVVHEPQVRT